MSDQTEYYYIIKDIVTVCLIKDGINIARGVTILSPYDPFNEVDGRERAYGYAMEALIAEKAGFPVKRLSTYETLSKIADCLQLEGALPFEFHSYFNPRLTKYERSILPHYHRLRLPINITPFSNFAKVMKGFENVVREARKLK